MHSTQSYSACFQLRGANIEHAFQRNAKKTRIYVSPTKHAANITQNTCSLGTLMYAIKAENSKRANGVSTPVNSRRH